MVTVDKVFVSCSSRIGSDGSHSMVVDKEQVTRHLHQSVSKQNGGKISQSESNRKSNATDLRN